MSQEEEPIQVTLGGVIDEHGLELAAEPEAASPVPPSDEATSSPSPASAESADSAAEPVAESASEPAEPRVYRVQPSDSWEAIAAAHDVDPDALYAANADQQRIASAGRHGVPVGAVIMVPGVATGAQGA